MSARTIQSPVGALTIRARDGAIAEINLNDGADARDADEILLAAEKQLAEYFSGARRDFDLPLCPAGTPFQKAVWDALRAIPFGETRTYGEIAKSLGRPGAARAVGMANRLNPLPIVVPCHRVIGAGGGLTGYAYGLAMKQQLLSLEGARIG